MDLTTLAALGITKDELIDRVIDKAVEEILSTEDYDYDGESTGRTRTKIMRAVNDKIQKHVDAKIQALADEHILPKVADMIETLTLQETNKWGEKRGEPVTFIEYLTHRADAYMCEEVNFEGKSKEEGGSYSWSKSGTRVAYMVSKHLQYSIETAMRQALGIANSSIAKGLEEATKIGLQTALAGLKVQVSTK